VAFGYAKVAFLGVVQGITELLPIDKAAPPIANWIKFATATPKIGSGLLII
jgi:undecaprenyl pyrophosphate phosphatase UppP